MMTFVRFLPFMIGHYIPQGNEHWECFLLLWDICNATSAFQVTESDTLKLAWMVEAYLESYTTLYTTTLPPKFHYLLHLPNQILQLDISLVMQNLCSACMYSYSMAHTDLKSHTRCSAKLKQWNLSITVTFGPQFLGLNKQMAALDR